MRAYAFSSRHTARTDPCFGQAPCRPRSHGSKARTTERRSSHAACGCVEELEDYSCVSRNGCPARGNAKEKWSPGSSDRRNTETFPPLRTPRDQPDDDQDE
jgi:hypothetical protein